MRKKMMAKLSSLHPLLLFIVAYLAAFAFAVVTCISFWYFMKAS